MGMPLRGRALVGSGLLAAVAAVAVSGCGISIERTKHEHQDISYSLDSTGLKNLAFHVSSGDVQITGSSTNSQIQVHERLNYTTNHKPAPTHRVSDGTLSLAYQCPGNGLSIGFSECSVDYTVQVPAALALDLHDGSGDVRLDHWKGDVQAHLGSGNLVAHDLTGSTAAFDLGSGDVGITGASGALKVHTSSGQVRLTSLRSVHVTGDSSSGDVTAAFVSPPTDAVLTTGSGQIRVTLPARYSYAVDASTDSGDRPQPRVPTDPNSPYHVRAHSSSGDVNVD